MDLRINQVPGARSSDREQPAGIDTLVESLRHMARREWAGQFGSGPGRPGGALLRPVQPARAPGTTRATRATRAEPPAPARRPVVRLVD